MSEIIKDNLTYRERQVVTMHLGLDSGKAVPFSQMSKLFSIKADKLGLIYREAIGKLSEAILAHPKWRRSK
jgi:DNA-directed RNA polymerase sigma subunit (sigma70/sigma32)